MDLKCFLHIVISNFIHTLIAKVTLFDELITEGKRVDCLILLQYRVKCKTIESLFEQLCSAIVQNTGHIPLLPFFLHQNHFTFFIFICHKLPPLLHTPWANSSTVLSTVLSFISAYVFAFYENIAKNSDVILKKAVYYQPPTPHRHVKLWAFAEIKSTVKSK